ncbi:MAG: cytochrome c [Betaproteobacteria bacterium]
MFYLLHRKAIIWACAWVFAYISVGVAAAQSGARSCPQPRFTGKAPDAFYNLKSPVSAATEDTKLGEKLYFDGATDRFSCATCHGAKGDGRGEMAKQYDPPPRNFACAQTINGVPDGQLFWIIRFGSPGTAMPAHKHLSDNQVWQLISYVRGLAK